MIGFMATTRSLPDCVAVVVVTAKILIIEYHIDIAMGINRNPL